MRRRVGGSGSPPSDWGHRGLKRNENKKWGEQNTFQIWNNYILDSFHSKLSALEILISIGGRGGAGGIKMLTKSRRKLKEEKEGLDKTLVCQTPSQVPAMGCPNCWTVPGGETSKPNPLLFKTPTQTVVNHHCGDLSRSKLSAPARLRSARQPGTSKIISSNVHSRDVSIYLSPV